MGSGRSRSGLGATLCLSAALGLAPTAARAQAPATALDPVDVPSGKPAASAPTASSPLQREPSASISVVELSDRRAEAKDTAEHLASVPGAVVQDAGGAGQRKTLSLRGTSPNAVLVLLDGVPLTAPGTTMDLARVPAAALDRIEVLRGAGSRYGPGAMGGVVNLVTRTPDAAPHAFGAISQGSFVTTRLEAGASGTVGPGEGLVLLHGLRSDGRFDFRYQPTPEVPDSATYTLPRTNNQALEGGGLLRYRLPFFTGQLDLLAEGLWEARGLAGTVQNPTPDAAQRTARGTLSARSTTPLPVGGTLGVLAFGRLDVTELSGGLYGSAPYRQLDGSAGVEATYTQLLGRHGLSALVTGGGDWLREPSNVNPSWGRVGASVGDEVLFFDGALSVNAVVRVDLAGPFVVLSPKGGVTVQLPAGLTAKLSVGQASRAPSFLELYVLQGTLLPNPTLRPERALTADATVEWAYECVTLAATGFGTLAQDLIAYEYYPPSLAKPFNFSAAGLAGAELEAHVKPTTWLDASAAYTFLATQDLKDDPRSYLKALPFRPAHRVQARVVAGWVPLLTGRAEVLYQSAQYINRTNTVALPGRALLNLAVSSSPFKNPALTLSFEVKNVLDVQAQDVDGYPLPPRSAYLTLGVAWDGARK